MTNPSFILPSAPAYDEGNLYGLNVYYDPTNFVASPMTVTRATTATRVNSAGLVELVPYNLLTYSEKFDNAAWTKANVSISANTTTAPNGTLTTDSIIENSALSTHVILQSATLSATTYTYSVYVKAISGSSRNVGILFNTTGKGVLLNPSTGAVVTYFNTTAADVSISNVGNGWFRVSVTALTAAITESIRIYLGNGTTWTAPYLGDGTSGAYIWGAQVVEGTSARDYQKTETRLNIPRLDYSLGGCPNILLEPQRTNLVTYSEQFDNAAWTKVNSTITANAETAPNGTLTADLYTALTDSDRIQSTVSYASATYTFSIWVKNTGSNVDGIITFGGIGTVNFTATNEWQRITATATTSIAASLRLLNAGETVYIWGAQLEAGAYPTSYIPTTSASVTRNADVFIRDNIYTNNLITSSGGTWFIEMKNNTAYTSDSNVGAIFLDTANFGYTNGLLIRKLTSNRIRIQSYASTVGSSLYQTTTDNVKIAIKWNGTTADVFVNGVKEVSAAAFTTTNMQFLGNNTTPFLAYISSMALFPEPLTDDELEELTGEGFDTYELMAENYNYTLQ